MISIRLSKIGKKNRPAYRIVAANKRSGRDGRPIEILGYFDPQAKKVLGLKRQRWEYWQKQGAQMTKAVAKLLESA